MAGGGVSCINRKAFKYSSFLKYCNLIGPGKKQKTLLSGYMYNSKWGVTESRGIRLLQQVKYIIEARTFMDFSYNTIQSL